MTGEPMLPEQEGVWDNYCVKRQCLQLSTVRGLPFRDRAERGDLFDSEWSRCELLFIKHIDRTLEEHLRLSLNCFSLSSFSTRYEYVIRHGADSQEVVFSRGQ